MTWFDRWQARLVDRLRRADWPETESEWWADLRDMVARTGCDEPTANAAIGSLAQAEPQYIGEVRGALVAAIEALSPAKRTRAEAEKVSRGCPECGGDGATVRYVQRRDGRTGRHALICHRCAAGQWLREWWKAHELKTGERAPIPDLADWPQYQDERLKWAWDPGWVRVADPAAF